MFGGARGQLKAEVLRFKVECCVRKMWSSFHAAAMHVRSSVALAVTLQNALCALQSHIQLPPCESQHCYVRLVFRS